MTKKFMKRRKGKLAPRKRNSKLRKNKSIKLIPSGPVSQLGPHGVRFHKGYVYDEIRHTVLTITQMSEKDKLFVQSVLKTITSGPEALTLPDKPGWACEEIGMHRKVYLVKYHGIEVALFFKRQLTEVKLLEGDSFPAHVLQDPEEAWQRLDILGPSAKKANLVLTTKVKDQTENMRLLNMRIQALVALNEKLEYINTQKEAARERAAKALAEVMKRRRKK